MTLPNLILPPWVKWAAIAAAALALYMLGRIDGARLEGAKHSDYLLAQAARGTELQRVRERIVTQVEIKYRDRIQVVHEKGETIIKEVPVYVSPETDRRFPLPGGFVRVHDAAIDGVPVAGGALESDGQASGITASEAASTVAFNYKQCRVWREQVIGWQDYYRRQREIE